MIGTQRKSKRRGATPITEQQTRRNPQASRAASPARSKKERNTLSTNSNSLNQLIRYHRLALSSCIKRLISTPMASFLTLLVLAIALALPAGMQVVLNNAKHLTGELGDSAQISLFLKMHTPEAHAKRVAKTLAERPDIKNVDYISPDQALAEFEHLSGIRLGLATLDENPLPAVLVVYPEASASSVEMMQALLSQLESRPEVDMAQLDLEWVQRLYALVDLAGQAAAVLSLFLVVAVILIVGNTIRLMSQNHLEEIRVSKLVGATDAFVRRPFLYTGALLGLGGALLACGFVLGTSLWLQTPLERLTLLYQSDFSAVTLSAADIFILCFTGLILGVIGARLAVGKFIRQFSL
ncbi:MAG: permease-like cell division protein FtsX [Gammaproteobacteria bacterium]|nr:permease-like cell division protein FtsX [Gammaproteobacteria bacterium]MDH5691620.1 permease-like cell division protein FtsX [Gammaproteobacteria bacterium]